MKVLAFFLALFLATPALADDLWQPISSYTIAATSTTVFATGKMDAQAVRLVCTVDCFVAAATATDAPAIAATQPIFLPADEPIIIRASVDSFILVNADTSGDLHVTELSK